MSKTAIISIRVPASHKLQLAVHAALRHTTMNEILAEHIRAEIAKPIPVSGSEALIEQMIEEHL